MAKLFFINGQLREVNCYGDLSPDKLTSIEVEVGKMAPKGNYFMGYITQKVIVPPLAQLAPNLLFPPHPVVTTPTAQTPPPDTQPSQKSRNRLWILPLILLIPFLCGLCTWGAFANHLVYWGDLPSPTITATATPTTSTPTSTNGAPAPKGCFSVTEKQVLLISSAEETEQFVLGAGDYQVPNPKFVKAEIVTFSSTGEVKEFMDNFQKGNPSDWSCPMQVGNG